VRAAEEARQRVALLARQAEEERARQAKEQAENLARQEQLRKQLLEQRLKQQEEEEARQRVEAERQRLEAEMDNIHDASSLIIPKPAARELQAYRELMTVSPSAWILIVLGVFISCGPQKIKVDIMPTLKTTKLNPDFVPDPQVKRALNQARRAITPKIGQITNVQSVLERVVRNLLIEVMLLVSLKL
jgi:nucleoporin GLE1